MWIGLALQTFFRLLSQNRVALSSIRGEIPDGLAETRPDVEEYGREVEVGREPRNDV